MRTTVALVCTAAWFGAALITTASVAPAAFEVLPTRTLAGTLVGRVLPAVFLSGIAVGIIGAWLAYPASRARTWASIAIAAACAIAQFVVNPRIARLRAEIGPALDAIAVDDPRRVSFGQLHAISVAWLGAAMLAAAIFMILTLLAARRQA